MLELLSVLNIIKNMKCIHLFFVILVDMMEKIITQTRLESTPKTLIINLNHGKGLQYNVKIIFDNFFKY